MPKQWPPSVRRMHWIVLYSGALVVLVFFVGVGGFVAQRRQLPCSDLTNGWGLRIVRFAGWHLRWSASMKPPAGQAAFIECLSDSGYRVTRDPVHQLVVAERSGQVVSNSAGDGVVVDTNRFWAW